MLKSFCIILPILHHVSEGALLLQKQFFRLFDQAVLLQSETELRLQSETEVRIQSETRLRLQSEVGVRMQSETRVRYISGKDQWEVKLNDGHGKASLLKAANLRVF